MPKSVAEYLRMPYERVVIPQESGRFYAKIAEFPGCFTGGESAQEALANLEETAAIWIEEMLKKGNQIPLPHQEQEYSGKFMLRITPLLHQECAENAERQGLSLNQYVGQKLAAKAREDSVVHIFREELAGIRPSKVIIIQTGGLSEATIDLPQKGIKAGIMSTTGSREN